MNAKEFLANKGVFNLDTKKRYSEVVAWMEEYAAFRQCNVSGQSEQLDTAEKRNIFNDGYSLGLKTGKRQLEKGV